MASTSSINSNSSGSQAPNPPPRTHSRPNQPPPPPPLPTVPPVPPPRDSSIAIAQNTINSRTGNNSTEVAINQSHNRAGMSCDPINSTGGRFLAQFDALFRPLTDLPPPDPFTNKPKSYPSQKALQKQQQLQLLQLNNQQQQQQQQQTLQRT